jgi:hypothetical protein
MADKPFPTFQIIEFPDPASVVGRNCGSDVMLGNVFTQIVRQDFTAFPPDNMHMTETILVDNLSIELAGIEMYRQNRDVLPSGYTAKLRLVGADVSELYALRAVLGPHVYLAIESPMV